MNRTVLEKDPHKTKKFQDSPHPHQDSFGHGTAAAILIWYFCKKINLDYSTNTSSIAHCFQRESEQFALAENIALCFRQACYELLIRGLYSCTLQVLLLSG